MPLDDELHDLRHRPLIFVDDLDAPELTDDDLHHFERVLRIGSGTAVAIGDGNGRWRPARFGRRPEPDGDIRHADRPEPTLTVAFTPVKATRPEWVVQKLTELGIDRIVPVITERSVVSSASGTLKYWIGTRRLRRWASAATWRTVAG